MRGLLESCELWIAPAMAALSKTPCAGAPMASATAETFIAISTRVQLSGVCTTLIPADLI